MILCIFPSLAFMLKNAKTIVIICLNGLCLLLIKKKYLFFSKICGSVWKSLFSRRQNFHWKGNIIFWFVSLGSDSSLKASVKSSWENLWYHPLPSVLWRCKGFQHLGCLNWDGAEKGLVRMSLWIHILNQWQNNNNNNNSWYILNTKAIVAQVSYLPTWKQKQKLCLHTSFRAMKRWC